MSEELKQHVQKIFEEAYNKGNLDVLDELIAPDYRRYQPPMKKVVGLDNYKAFITEVRQAYSDFKMTVEEILAEGSKTVARIILNGKHTGRTPTLQTPPTGKEVTMLGCVVSTWEKGKIVEEWAYNDYMGLTQQFGVMPLMIGSFE